MGICLRHVETIVRDRFFLIDFAFVCKVIHRKTYPGFDSPIHGEHNGANCNSAHPFSFKLSLFKLAPVIYFPNTLRTN